MGDKVGAVLVVGGGIGGMQSALDLAESGFKVYLLEKKPSIGGHMAQLDKTFPTNECAMCTMSPKLVDVGRHPNIEMITYSELEEVSGEAGNFDVRIRRKAGFVDFEKCTGCGECTTVCPVDLDSEFDECLAIRHAIYKLYPQAIPNKCVVDKLDKKSPCKVTCPSFVNAQGYIQLIGMGKYAEALNLVRERNPFPAICGRVCHHPCEDQCLRGTVDEPVAIRPLKRFAADWVMENGEGKAEKLIPLKDEKIAVIGAGPAGLTCARELTKRGYPVTVIDAADKPGGMMTSCMPNYRIDEKTTMFDINRILDEGIEIKTGTRVGRDISFEDLKKEYGSIFISIGYQDPARLKIDGADSSGVLYGIPFLRDAKGEKAPMGFGKRIIVIGGGNVAMDCARSAVRLGAEKVDIVCLETRDLSSRHRMPAHAWEIEEGEDEGISIHGSLGPKTINAEGGKVTGLQTVNCTKVYDDDHNFAPEFSDEAGPQFNCDTVIIAIGQRPNRNGFDEIEANPWGTIKAKEITLETSIEGVFAGGDIRRGPASVIEAVRDGFDAAESIDRYISGRDLKEGRCAEEYAIDHLREEVAAEARKHMPMAPPEERIKDFREVELGYDEDTAIAEAKRCLSCSICCECLQCQAACEADAIDLSMTDTFENINVGSIIMAPGFEMFNARRTNEYGYKRFANVLTSLEFERILSASGPYQGHVIRPSDESEPKKVAWINCVGSRDRHRGNNYCSSVCCTYAIKEAVIAKEHVKTLEATIFYIDRRTFGKGFEAYYERAKNEGGVNFVNCRVASVEELEESKNLAIRYETEGQIVEEEFDLVVLCTGFEPPEEVKKLSEILDIELNEYNFCSTSELTPVKTSKKGVFVCGAFAGPKDIPETVIGGSGAAAEASALISQERDSLVVGKQYPPEISVEGQEPRIGVFVCNCGFNIGGYLDVPGIVEYAKTLPNVVYTEDNLYTCSQDTQKKITEKITELNLNRVVVSSCTPRTHEPLFQSMLREAGLNPYLFEMANIRDQCSWVHMNVPDMATDKAKDLVRIAVTKSRLLEPLEPIYRPVIQKGLIIGGGLAGMTAALAIADQGYVAYIVEKEGHLGGNLINLHYTLENDNIQGYLASLINRVEENPNIKIFTDSTVKAINGYVGNYESTVRDGISESMIEHGTIIVATGANELKPDEYLYGKNEKVITQLELEKKIADGGPVGKTVVMIQCVGSRDEERPYCSRVCCTEAVKNAIKIKDADPDTQIFIIFRDIRTYGFKEKAYEEARERGVIFIRYDVDGRPLVESVDGVLQVRIRDKILDEVLAINPDLLVLSAAMVPPETNEELAKLLKVPTNTDGFFLEAHVKLRPVDFATEGIFMAGLAHSPRSISETISQAFAAASRACTLISHDTMEKSPRLSFVVDKYCDGCAYCVDPCPFNAITLVEYMRDGQIKKTVEVNEALCKGCGVCMATCPKLGVYVRGFTYEQIMSQGKTAVEITGEGPPEEDFEPRLVAFCCNWCSYTGADLAGVARFQYPPNVRIIRVMCSGMVHPTIVIETLLAGADGVLMCGCHPGDCHYLEGNLKAKARADTIDLLLEDFELEPERYRLEWVSASEGPKFAQIIRDTIEDLRALGPSPYRQY